MLSTLQAVQEAKVDADKLDPWSRDDNFDIVHLWGLELNHSKVLHFAKKAGKKVAVGTIMECTICLSDFKFQESCRITCGHVFCTDCWGMYLEVSIFIT